jgi:hypothetical protein
LISKFLEIARNLKRLEAVVRGQCPGMKQFLSCSAYKIAKLMNITKLLLNRSQKLNLMPSGIQENKRACFYIIWNRSLKKKLKGKPLL